MKEQYKYDVFISYSSKDQKVAEGVCGYLEERRIRCFVAYRDILPSQVWAGAIADAIDESRAMVVVFSHNFNISEQTDREIELASENKMPILTFRIDETAFKGTKKYYLKNINWIDAFPNPDVCFGKLCENICKLLSIKINNGEGKRGKEDVKYQEGNAHKQMDTATEHLTAEQMYDKAGMYYEGEGVTQDYAEAVRWFRKAAEQGHSAAQYDLGSCYYYGLGVLQNDVEAIRWFRKAAEQGLPDAQDMLGFCYQEGRGVAQDYAEAVRWFRKAAEQEDSEAQLSLGNMYCEGKGVPQNYAEAVRWYRKAAEQGNPDAQCNLGDCYYDGAGVHQDYGEAVRWYRKAAGQENECAQCHLGISYYYGLGVSTDMLEAKKWFQKAADNGLKEAKDFLAEHTFQ